MCLSLLQIQKLGQGWSKSELSQKDVRTPFTFLFPSVLLSLPPFKRIIGNVFCPAIFEWCKIAQ